MKMIQKEPNIQAFNVYFFGIEGFWKIDKSFTTFKRKYF